MNVIAHTCLLPHKIISKKKHARSAKENERERERAREEEREKEKGREGRGLRFAAGSPDLMRWAAARGFWEFCNRDGMPLFFFFFSFSFFRAAACLKSI